MRKTLVVLVLLHLVLLGISQITRPQLFHYNHLGVKEGLPGNMVSALSQDEEGFIWIGTLNGLVRYDGYAMKRYNLDGKSTGSIIPFTIYEDKQKTLWIGTNRGLYFYKRSSDEFAKYSLQEQNVHISYIMEIMDIGNHHLCISLYDERKGVIGVGLLDVHSHSLAVFSNKEKGAHYINSTEFSGKTVDQKGRLWIGSDKGLLEYNPVSKSLTTHYLYRNASPSYLGDVRIDSLHPEFVWFYISGNKTRAYEGLGRYNTSNNTVRIYRHQTGDTTSISSDRSHPLGTDAHHRLWFGTMNGLSVYNPEKDNFTNYYFKEKRESAHGEWVYSIYEDKKGNFWCRMPKGLGYFDVHTNTFTIDTVAENTENGLASNYIGNMMIDKNDALWFPFLEMGQTLQWIDKNSTKFTIYKKNTSAYHNFSGGLIHAFAEAPDGTFWLGSDKGLYHWQPKLGSFTPFEYAENQQKHNEVNAIVIDKEGSVWFTSAGKDVGGLYSYNPKTGTVRNYRHDLADTNSIPDNYIWRLFEDHRGDIWVGSANKGLCRFDKHTQKFIRYPYLEKIYTDDDTSSVNESKALDRRTVQCIYEDKQGTIWIGTWGGKLNRFNRNSATFTYYKSKLPDFGDVVTMFSDSKKRFWAGTNASGVFVLDQKTDVIKKLSEKNGLLYDGGWGIQEDNSGNIWIASPKGISILNPANNAVRTLTTEGGLPEDPAAFQLYKTSKGTFLFGCKNGFVELNPDDFAPDLAVPIVHVETVAFNKPQKTNGPKKDSSIVRYGKNKINLAFNENRITFAYVGLLYQNTSLIYYAYKLDGYDKGWIQAATNRSVTYTNLAPGTYTFHVKAANSDGVWSTKDESVIIVISPPWWRTWWAYVIYVSLFGLAIRSYAGYRSRSLRKHNRELEDKVNHRTLELFKANEELNITQQKISAQRDELAGTLENLQSTQKQLIHSEKMASLGELTAGIAHEIQNPLNFVNNFSEVSAELAEEMEEALQKDDKKEAFTIASDIKVNLQKINYHGKRADAIVKGMLQHSRTSSGKKEPTDVNALVDEFLRLSYHGLRAKDKSFNASFHTNLDANIGAIPVVPQDMGRVLLNLFNNAFYAVNEKKKQSNGSFEPTVLVTTKKNDHTVEICVKDNGTGIPHKAKDKIFQPFFTTKPTGQGTGLGLSLSYDIVTKIHGGKLKVETSDGEGAEFIVQLPV